MDGAPDTKSEQTEQRDGTAPEQIAKKPRVSPELRRELYGLHLAGKTDKELGEIMASRGHPMTRSAIMRARYSGQREAVLNCCSLPQSPPPDPQATSVELPQTSPPIPIPDPSDDEILRVLIRDAVSGLRAVKADNAIESVKKHELRNKYAYTIGSLTSIRATIRRAEKQTTLPDQLTAPKETAEVRWN